MSDHDASTRPSRRAMLGAGALGAAVALLRSQQASAATDERAALEFAVSLELTARDLYETAVDAGATGDLWPQLAEQHEAYATRLAGIGGFSADRRDDEVFDALAGGFRTTTTESALELENVAAATHADLLSVVAEDDAASTIAAISSMESRHATLLASLIDDADLDLLFLNDATALSPEG